MDAVMCGGSQIKCFLFQRNPFSLIHCREQQTLVMGQTLTRKDAVLSLNLQVLLRWRLWREASHCGKVGLPCLSQTESCFQTPAHCNCSFVLKSVDSISPFIPEKRCGKLHPKFNVVIP